MSQDKIKFYREVLELEPDSRLFFPLARLYADHDEPERSKEVLEKGLAMHPQHFEARILLASVMNKLGEKDRAEEIYLDIFAVLGNAHDFWQSISSILSNRGEKDLALAAAFIARSGSDRPLTWSDVMLAGMDNIGTGQTIFSAQDSRDMSRLEQDRTVFSQSMDNNKADHFPETGATDVLQDFSGHDSARYGQDNAVEVPDFFMQDEGFEDPEELPDFDIENEARTWSMADILFGQEEYAKARDIYLELWRKSLPGEERNRLREMIQSSEAALEAQEKSGLDHKIPEDRTDKSDKEEVISFLMALADRLEAKSAG